MTAEAGADLTWHSNVFPAKTRWASSWRLFVVSIVMAVLGVYYITRTDHGLVVVGVALLGVAVGMVGASLADDYLDRVPYIAISPAGLHMRSARGRTTIVPWTSMLSLEGPIPAYLTRYPCYVIGYRSAEGKTVTKSLVGEIGAKIMEELERRFPSGIQPNPP